MPPAKRNAQAAAVDEVDGDTEREVADQGTESTRLAALEEQMAGVTTALADVAGYIRGQTVRPQSTEISGMVDSSRARSSATKYFARPREFDGSVPWASYKSQFEAIASVHGWNDSDRVGELVACLKGPALEVFTHLSPEDQMQYGRLLSALEQRFGQTSQHLWFRSQFRRRTRNAGESLPALAQDMERLAALAYPAAEKSLKDSLACEQFLDGLADVELQIAVRQSRPEGLQEALGTAIEIEAIRKSAEAGAVGGSGFTARQIRTDESKASNECPVRKTSTTDEPLQAILHRIEVLEASVASPKQGRQFERRQQSWGRSNQSASEGCWHCGQPGHIRRLCPQRRAQAPYTPSPNQGN